MIFIRPETLDKLAEDILIASRKTCDAEGRRTNDGLPISEAPEAVRILLNFVFGGPDQWQAIGEWPRPEQMQPLKVPEGLEGILGGDRP